ncbi:carbohydrate kinase family protein [Leifsonia sp. NPDC014704]|uniref:Carbohydrate kinase family protein n=1 Tax=Leifsonia virtsii TaxID=3035915 RepID=A0ABT8J2P5_9MICO|nr:carbohydrate kinase family protein [Leifsonia virtsii]MDN4599358.1 carbohydrate kinase family protein [Leifsonia virtsii]
MGAAAEPLNGSELLVLGELCVDLIIPVDDEIRFGQHEQLVPATTLTMGSSSAITACGAAALGTGTRLISVRGDDTFGRFLDAELRRLGVGTALIRVDATLPTGASTHLTRPDGDRAILTSLGSIGTVSADDAPDAVLRTARHLHVGSYFLQTALQPDARALFARARALGLSTSLDGNFDPSQDWDSGVLDALAEVDVLFGNDAELCGIARDDDAASAVRLLLDRMPEGAIVVRKLGPAGAQAWERIGSGLRVLSCGIPAVPGALIDTVGAGDTLAAGFVSARLRGEPTGRSLAIAVSCGSASTRGPGGVGAQPGWDTARSLAATLTVAQNGD